MEKKRRYLRVKRVRNLTESAYIIEFERNNLYFQSGQYICLGIVGIKTMREYTIYSGEQDADLKVLIKKVESGLISKKLLEINTGDKIPFEGPFGNFILKPGEIVNKKFYFVSTGTGIAPFHSFIRTYPHLSYKLLHGVKTSDEAYERELYNNYILCASKDTKGQFYGRVTEYLRQNAPASDSEFYLCGNGNMIYEVIEILKNYFIPLEQIHYEIYF